MTSVALVVLDTLRKDYFDVHFDWLPGRRFERAFTTANWTVPAHCSLFTGRYPSECDTHAKSPQLSPSCTPIAELLNERGVTTRCWTANPNLSRELGWHRGFEEFVDAHVVLTGDSDALNWAKFAYEHADESALKFPKAILESLVGDYDTVASLRNGILSKTTDGQLNTVRDEGAQTILERTRRTDFDDEGFLFINMMEPHGYDPPAEYGNYDTHVSIDHSIGTHPEPDETVDAYDASVEYLSDVYREIFAELRSQFEYVITLADHGEMLGENGYWGHTYGLYPEISHIPLVVSGDDLSGSSTATASVLDVHRTMVEMFDLSIDSRGTNLLEIDAGSERFVEYHGLVSTAVDRLEEESASADLIETLERYLVGVAAPPDYYGYESREGFVEDGTYDEAQPALTDFRTMVQAMDAGGDDRDLSDRTRKRLEDLGYS